VGNKGLGKGLGALLPDLDQDESVREVPLKELRPNPYQPRKKFDEEALAELGRSIKRHGLVQPLIVRKSIHGYEIVAGERRFRAAEMVNLERVPVVVRECDEDQMMEIALIENLQREDLNPLEIAKAYQKLMEHLSLTQEELAERVGKGRSSVTNFLRLLQLPPEIQEEVSRGTLSMGHARALLAIKDKELQKKVAKQVIKEGLSVRQLEELTQKMSQARSRQQAASFTPPQYRQFEDLLQEVLSTPVKIHRGRKKGRIEIEFYSEKELERLVELLHQQRFIN
jgi:ParB family chromosome partitioning protein